MSEEELVQRYIDGKLSRRSFIRKAMAAGISATAALTYADMLGNAAHAAGTAGTSGAGTTGGTGGTTDSSTSSGYGGTGGTGTTGGTGGVRRPKP